jgi:hypothetical protein
VTTQNDRVKHIVAAIVYALWCVGLSVVMAACIVDGRDGQEFIASICVALSAWLAISEAGKIAS